MAQAANREERENPRYHWLGEQAQEDCMIMLARAQACVLSSRAEGGAHSVLEAIATRTPLLATRIPGNVGLLGADYPGYFEVGDEIGLAALLTRLEADADFRDELVHALDAHSALADPERERSDLAALLDGLADDA
jgi:glycosyltransferase involved in cell wall biosynthesis